jgi:hypothetical protein
LKGVGKADLAALSDVMGRRWVDGEKDVCSTKSLENGVIKTNTRPSQSWRELAKSPK